MTVRFAIGTILATGLLALPATAGASQGGQVSELSGQQCLQERAELGGRTFRKRYGEKHSMRSCRRRTRARVTVAIDPATADCQSELAEETAVEFIDDYGEDAATSLDEAMAECVAEGVDYLLNPEDYVDGGSDEEE